MNFIPALTACTSERMKTIGFSYFLGFAAREHKREPKPVVFEKAALSRFFDILKGTAWAVPLLCVFVLITP